MTYLKKLWTRQKGTAKGAIHDFEAPAIGDASEVIISDVYDIGCVDPPHFAVLK